MSLRATRTAVSLAVFSLASARLHGQTSSPARMRIDPNFATKPGRLICPGGFSTDLTVTSCAFTRQNRVMQWVTSSFTDQAMLGAVVYGAGAQIIQSPGDWGRNWGGYGARIGVRYSQGAARGTAELIVGSLLHDNPRHLSYAGDPKTPIGTKIVACPGGVPEGGTFVGVPAHLIWRRIGHALADSVTVRRSDVCGIGARLPALDRLAGVTASAYGGYPWYPRADNTPASLATRAATAYGSTLVGSVYAEFSPELSALLTKIFLRRAKQP